MESLVVAAPAAHHGPVAPDGVVDTAPVCFGVREESGREIEVLQLTRFPRVIAAAQRGVARGVGQEVPP